MEIKEKIKKDWNIDILDEDVKYIEQNGKVLDSYWFQQKMAQHYGLEKITRQQELIYKEVEKTPFCNTKICKKLWS